jgi:hypothetical protein
VPAERRQLQDIQDVVATYMAGMTRGDAALLRRAFHPAAHCIGHFDGGLEWDDLEAFIATCATEAKGADATAFWRVNSVSIVGDTAVVQLSDDWAGMRFDDTLTLLRHDGRWQIVSKLFYHRS